MARKMSKAAVTAIIEAELQRQAAQGKVSSKLIESYVSIRKWRKPKASRAVVPPSVQPAEVPLPELIAQARQLEEASGTAQPPATTRPVRPPQAASAPAAPPQPVPSQGKTPVRRGALDILLGITDEQPTVSSPRSHPEPAPPPPPRPAMHQVYPISHLDLEDRPVIADCTPEPQNGGDYLFW